MNKKGFTLVEILAVIVILGLVMTIVGTKGFGAFDNTKKAITSQNINAIKEAGRVLATQIENCDDDDVNDRKLYESDNRLVKDITNCSELIDKMSKDGIDVTVKYLINNGYLSDNKDFDSIKDKKIQIKKEKDEAKKTEKVVIDTTEIEEAIKKPSKDTSDDKVKKLQNQYKM